MHLNYSLKKLWRYRHHSQRTALQDLRRRIPSYIAGNQLGAVSSLLDVGWYHAITETFKKSHVRNIRILEFRKFAETFLCEVINYKFCVVVIICIYKAFIICETVLSTRIIIITLILRINKNSDVCLVYNKHNIKRKRMKSNDTFLYALQTNHQYE